MLLLLLVSLVQRMKNTIKREKPETDGKVLYNLCGKHVKNIRFSL